MSVALLIRRRNGRSTEIKKTSEQLAAFEQTQNFATTKFGAHQSSKYPHTRLQFKNIEDFAMTKT